MGGGWVGMPRVDRLACARRSIWASLSGASARLIFSRSISTAGPAFVLGFANAGDEVVLTCDTLVRTGFAAVDAVEGVAGVVGQGVGRGDDVRPGLDLDGAAAAGGLDEPLD